jgi:histone-lysine N-methyltransferase SETD8
VNQKSKEQRKHQDLAAEAERTHDNDLPLEVKDTIDKGRGVFATEALKRGDFVLEYSGELLSGREARERDLAYSHDYSLGSYLYFFKWKNQTFCVDSSVDNGRLGRLVNHSIENANLKAKVFDHKGEPRILFFAIKDINPGDELLYDYGERRPEVVKDFPWLAL